MTPQQRRECVAILKAKLAVARVTTSKAQALLDRVCADGRLRGVLAYYGAHTGRWAGRGFQPQNLPKRPAELPEDIYDTPENAPLVAEQRDDLETADILGALLRSCVVAPEGRYLAAVDLRQIEARGLLWLAGDEANLAPYRRGEDPYRRLGAHIWGCAPEEVTDTRRSICKVIVLAAGFGGGEATLKAFAKKANLDLSEAGLAPIDLIDGWRDAHPLVAGTRCNVWRTPDGRDVVVRRGGLWKDTQKAAWDAVLQGATTTVGRCTWWRDGDHLRCTLPSGRDLLYRFARVEPQPTRWGTVADTLTYFVPGRGRQGTYGARLAQNGDQATCRDILAEALCALEHAGLRPVLHVHDEVICEVDSPDDLARVEEIMRRVPPWAAGMPIDVEGTVGRRYAK